MANQNDAFLVADAALDPATGSSYKKNLRCDLDGNLFVTLVGSGSGGIVTFNAYLPDDGDNQAAPAATLAVGAFGVGFNGVGYDRQRFPSAFLTSEKTTSATLLAVAGGTYFRVMGLAISVCGTIAGAAGLVLTLSLGATPFYTAHVFAGAVITGDTQLGADYGNGIAGADGADLSITFSEALLTGSAGVNVWGILETP